MAGSRAVDLMKLRRRGALPVGLICIPLFGVPNGMVTGSKAQDTVTSKKGYGMSLQVLLNHGSTESPAYGSQSFRAQRTTRMWGAGVVTPGKRAP